MRGEGPGILRGLAGRLLGAATAILLGVRAATAPAESAWTQPPGSFYVKLGWSTLTTSKFFAPNGERIELARFRGRTGNLYGEYGVARDVTLVLDLPFVRQNSFETTETFTGLGDILIDLKYQFVRGSTPLAVSVGFGLPTGDENGFVRVRGEPDSSRFRLPTGDGAFNSRLRLYASHSFHPLPVYVSAGGGYDLRAGGLTDEVLYFFEAGALPLPSVAVTGKLRGLQPVRQVDLARAVGFGVGEGVEYTIVGGEVAWEAFPRTSISVGYFLPVRGKNIFASASWIFGVSISR